MSKDLDEFGKSRGECGDEFNRQLTEFKSSVENGIERERLMSLGGRILIWTQYCPNDARFLLLLIDVDLALGENVKALRRARYAYRQEPENEFVLEKLGSVLLINGFVDEGLEYIEQAVLISPDNLGILINYCSSLLEARRFREAVKACSAVIDKDRSNGVAFALRGKAYRSMGMMKRAEQDFGEARSLGIDEFLN